MSLAGLSVLIAVICVILAFNLNKQNKLLGVCVKSKRLNLLFSFNVCHVLHFLDKYLLTNIIN